jgi:hypothetical protein
MSNKMKQGLGDLENSNQVEHTESVRAGSEGVGAIIEELLPLSVASESNSPDTNSEKLKKILDGVSTGTVIEVMQRLRDVAEENIDDDPAKFDRIVSVLGQIRENSNPLLAYFSQSILNSIYKSDVYSDEHELTDNGFTEEQIEEDRRLRLSNIWFQGDLDDGLMLKVASDTLALFDKSGPPSKISSKVDTASVKNPSGENDELIPVYFSDYDF